MLDQENVEQHKEDIGENGFCGYGSRVVDIYSTFKNFTLKPRQAYRLTCSRMFIHPLWPLLIPVASSTMR